MLARFDTDAVAELASFGFTTRKRRKGREG